MNIRHFLEIMKENDWEDFLTNERMEEIVVFIGNLKPLCLSDKRTSDTVHEFLYSKVRQSVNRVLPSGEIVSCDKQDPDTSLKDKYVIVLYEFFNKLYEERTCKTISFAYAYYRFLCSYNRLSGAIKNYEVPDTSLQNIVEAIEVEKISFSKKETTSRKENKSSNDFLLRIIAKDKKEVLEKLHSMIGGKKGKSVALIIQAAIIVGVITKPKSSEVKKEFGDIGNASGYNKYMQKGIFTNDELNPIIKQLMQ